MRYRPQVWSRPNEPVHFGQHDPAWILLQAKPSARAMAGFDAIIGRGWGPRRDRQNQDDLVSILLLQHQDNGARAIFAGFCTSTGALVNPQIVLTDDLAGTG